MQVDKDEFEEWIVSSYEDVNPSEEDSFLFCTELEKIRAESLQKLKGRFLLIFYIKKNLKMNFLDDATAKANEFFLVHSTQDVEKEKFEDWLVGRLKDSTIQSQYVDFYWDVFVEYRDSQIPIEVIFSLFFFMLYI